MTTPLADLWPGPLPAPAVRTADEMRCVLADPAAPCDGPLYFMYRDCALTPEDSAWLGGQGVRFDLTVIPPAVIGGEYVKTKGHYHPENPAGVGYPEVYQVLAGEAHYLLQRKDLSDVVAVTARSGEFVFIPPGYGHVTVNPGKEVLVMANLVSTRFSSEYGVYEERRGAAYYEMEGGAWVRNARYGAVPEIREIRAQEVPEFGIRHGRGIYDLVAGPADLSFLNEPERMVVA
ncbi:glucose-6-phosphate isomerase [Methanofollis liminatans DSM 4140]|uniref:glucose-6-phosphate isomerase n=1 Tax=Methanofollis liminatans DSM 4140 TaxID=28892 RepID=J1L134_9EURY|nr:glucose-6-phosphate isomerase family protein [Methanofollis liminatans]EJG06727.1 glucose-6-phosphate isomerase [Methanofollis liminatans DSM 4140]